MPGPAVPASTGALVFSQYQSTFRCAASPKVNRSLVGGVNPVVDFHHAFPKDVGPQMHVYVMDRESVRGGKNHVLQVIRTVAFARWIVMRKGPEADFTSRKVITACNKPVGRVCDSVVL